MPASKQVPAVPADPTDDTLWGTPLRMFGLVLATLILALLAWLFAPIAEMILLGFVFAFVFHALAIFTQRFGAPYTWSTIVIYLLIALAGVTLILSIGRIVLINADSLIHAVQGGATLLRSGTLPGMDSTTAALLRDIGLPELISVGVSIATQFATRMSLGLASLVGFVATVMIALLFAFMLQLGLRANRRGALAWVPASHKRDATLLLARLDQTWAGYLVAGIIFAAVLAFLSYIQFRLMNVPFALVLAVVTGFLTLIPSIGGLLATAIVFVITLVLGPTTPMGMDNLAFSLLVAIINGVITQATYYFVGLPLTGRGVQLPIAIVLIGSAAGLATGSMLFAWLTVPIIATLRILLGYLISKANGRDPFPDEPMPEGPQTGFLSQLLQPGQNGQE